jgi:hypothetical protein
MKTSFIALALAWLLNQPAALQGQEPRLSYALRPGDVYMLEIDLQQSTHSESMDREEISFYTLTKLVFTVDSTDAAKDYHMRVQYQDLLLSMLAPQLNMDISSSSGKSPLLTRMMELLEKESFHLSMSPAGELKNLEGLERFFKNLGEESGADSLELEVVLNTLNEAFGPHAFSSLFEVFLWIYPVISPMNNWTNDITYYFNTKPVELVNRYALSKATDKVLVIQGLGMLNASKEFLETTSMGEVKSTVSGSQTYDFQVDRTSGWPIRCVSRQRVLIETTILQSNYFPTGLKIPSYTETVFEVTGSKVQ